MGEVRASQHHRIFRSKSGSPLARISTQFCPNPPVFIPDLPEQISLLGNHTVRPYVVAVNRVTLYLVSKAINDKDSAFVTLFSTILYG